MAQRILGMGDVVTLVEKAAEAVDQKKAMELEEKMRKGNFTLEDFLSQLREMKKLGPLEDIVKLLPGGNDMIKGADLSKSERDFRRMEGILCSMTLKERANPDLLNGKRRQRIARGSGVSVAEVNNMLRRFDEMRDMMRKMNKFQKMMGKFGGRIPGMG
jgi:signal recognition particle subunit SRP54